MNALALVAPDEFPLDFDVPVPLCHASIELSDSELAELVRLPWRHDRLRLINGPEPVLRCTHEHQHPGRHVAFGAESGRFIVWVAWDDYRSSRIFLAGYCQRQSRSGGLCVLPDRHAGRHAIGSGN